MFRGTKMNLILKYTLHLIKSCIEDKTPMPIPEELDLKELLKYGLEHKIENIMYESLKKLDLKEDELKEFSAYYMFGVYREASQQIALESILKEFSEHKIYNLPLKGSFLKSLYPSSNLRQMNDLDILISADDYIKAKEIMLELGFSTNEEIFGECYDDTYTKGNVLMVEIHRHLSREKNKWENIAHCIFNQKTIYTHKYSKVYEGYYKGPFLFNCFFH